MVKLDPSLSAYRYRLRPTAAQTASLERMAAARRFAYNWGLSRWKKFHGSTGGTITITQLCRELTELKKAPGFEWLGDVDSQLLQQALFDLRQAFRNFFERRARYPRFKSRKRDPLRFRIPQRVRLVGDRVYVPKVGWVRARVSRTPSGRIRSATFKRDSLGHWFVTLVSEREPPPVCERPGARWAVGIDVGIHDFAVMSNGERVASPRFAKRAERRLRRAHRKLSRTQLDSNRHRRARRQVARVHQRVRNQRNDFIHKLTTNIAQTFDFIAIEDLGVTGLARTKLARAIHDSGFYEFRRQLTYKSAWLGKELVVVDRFFPSSRRCSRCGEINRELTPKMRSWICVCGAAHDRDINAATNLLLEALDNVAVGRTDTKNGRGASVRLPTGAAGDEAATSG